MKPFKGTIDCWNIALTSEGYVIIGRPIGHPEFIGWMRTSLVVKFDPDAKEVETLNSRYKLGTPRLSVDFLQ